MSLIEFIKMFQHIAKFKVTQRKATNEQIVPTLAKARPNWKCNELFTVSYNPLCPAPSPPKSLKNIYSVFFKISLKFLIFF